MVFFPNCKINLGLRILRRREDGYHDLETVFYPLPLRDALEIIRSEELLFTATGIPIPGDAAHNLCLKAWHLLHRDFPDLPPVHIHLHKNIPIGAGLGGGSADGAQMLELLNKRFQIGIDTNKLLDYAAQLGSDCPFFLLNKPCLGTGRGEKLEPIELDLSGYSFVIVAPGVHISTAQAFALCTPEENDMPGAVRAGDTDRQSIKDILTQPIGAWARKLQNDFEEPVLRQYPSLRSIKDRLYAAGALYASLTGSGSSFFGIFQKNSIPSLIFEADYTVILLT
jgi:4-diphosphocytidyl-2-C-methyl-D-erythritol kinase